jgi:hypothetical protein
VSYPRDQNLYSLFLAVSANLMSYSVMQPPPLRKSESRPIFPIQPIDKNRMWFKAVLVPRFDLYSLTERSIDSTDDSAY